MKLITVPFLLMILLSFCACTEVEKTTTINLKELTISEIHKAYTDGSYNSQDLVKAYLLAIEEVDHEINAII